MELFKLFGTIAIDGAKEAQNDISGVSEEAKGFESRLQEGIKTVAKWGTAIVAGATAAAVSLAKFATSSASVADNVDKMSQKIGISREAYQELDFICSQSGTSVDNLQTGMKSLTSAMDSAASGTESAIEKFDLLGVSVTNADGSLRGQEEVMWETMVALQKMENQTEKARLATELFGRSGTELMPLLNGAAGSIEEMKEQAHELGLVLDDETIDSGVQLTDTLDQMKRGISAIVVQMGAKLMPVVQRASEYVIAKLPKISKVAQDLGSRLAKLFSSLEPVLESFINDVLPAILDGAQKIVPVISEIASKILPMITSALGFLVNNFTEIITVVGIAVAAFKTMQIINVVTTAIQGATSAFGALSAVMAANPIGMVVTAIGGLAVGISALTSLFRDNTESVSENVLAARAEAEASRESYMAYKDMKTAIEEKTAADLANISNTERLWNELQTLCDEQGNVSEADRARAEFIVGELNSALGTEIELTGNQIQGYEELQQTIADTIEMKKAEIYLQANEEAYTEAVKSMNKQKQDAVAKYNAYCEAQSKANQLRLERDALREQDAANMFDGTMHARVVAAEEAYNEQAAIAANLHSSWDYSEELYLGYCQDIQTYESASVAFQQGKADEVIQILDNKGKAALKAADIVGQATEEEKAQFLAQAQNATDYYKMLAEGYLKGVEGITEEMVQNAAEEAEFAWSEYQKVGGAMVDGIAAGANSGSDAINSAIMNIVKNGMSAGQSAAANYVPTKTGGAGTQSGASFYNSYYSAPKHAKGGVVKKGEIAFLEGEGTEAVVPLEKNTEWIGRVADNMASAINARQSGDGVATSALMAKFDELINVITQQRIYLDSDVLVGELTPALDTSLGDVYAGKARGR